MDAVTIRVRFPESSLNPGEDVLRHRQPFQQIAERLVDLRFRDVRPVAHLPLAPGAMVVDVSAFLDFTGKQIPAFARNQAPVRERERSESGFAVAPPRADILYRVPEFLGH